jgi:hypothetical protein
MAIIKLDYDRKTIPVYKIDWITRFFKLIVKDVKVWKTRKGTHIKIEVEQKIHPITITLIQSLMASDYRREAYNALRAYQLDEKKGSAIKQNWNVLYYKKKIAGEVVSEEKFDEERSKRLKEILCLKP